MITTGSLCLCWSSKREILNPIWCLQFQPTTLLSRTCILAMLLHCKRRHISNEKFFPLRSFTAGFSHYTPPMGKTKNCYYQNQKWIERSFHLSRFQQRIEMKEEERISLANSRATYKSIKLLARIAKERTCSSSYYP